MVRGLMFMFAVWAFVSAGIMLFMHMGGRDKMNLAKVALYGFLTALVTGAVLVAMVQVF